MYDDIDLGQPVDYDDLDLPSPEGEGEDVSEEPTVAAGTEELLAAVTAKVHTQHTLGEVELEAEHEHSEPTLAHQLPPPVVPAPPAASPAPPALAPTPAPAAAAAPSAPATAPSSSLGSVLLVSLLLLGLIAGAVVLAGVAS